MVIGRSSPGRRLSTRWPPFFPLGVAPGRATLAPSGAGRPLEPGEIVLRHEAHASHGVAQEAAADPLELTRNVGDVAPEGAAPVATLALHGLGQTPRGRLARVDQAHPRTPYRAERPSTRRVVRTAKNQGIDILSLERGEGVAQHLP